MEIDEATAAGVEPESLTEADARALSSDEVAFAGLARQVELVRGGAISPRVLVDLCLERIERFDPQLNAFRVVFADRARSEAEQAAGRLAAGEQLPLLGVPVAVKDNVDVAGEATLHGSRIRRAPARADAEIVRRLRAAGAIVIGKTNMPELAIWPWTESAARGYTHNPWSPERSCGGSSGGSAAAVAAGLIGAASATDGGGSIRIPAASCGLFGLKPQEGRVTFAPDGEHWYGLTAAGCLTRSVADTALWLDVVAGSAPGDPPGPPPFERPLAEVVSDDPRRMRIAVSHRPAALCRIDRRSREAVERIADSLRSLGHEVERADPDYGVIEPLFTPRWLRGIRDDARATGGIAARERRTRALARMGALTAPTAVARARAASRARAKRIGRLFERYDLLLTHVVPRPPDQLGRFEGRSTAMTLLTAAQLVAFTCPWNVTGQPAASIPAPVEDRGVPLAAQLVAPPAGEAAIVALAAQLERELRWTERRPAL